MEFLQKLIVESDAFVWFDKISLKFLSRFLVNLIATFVLVRFIYFPNYRRSDLFLTFFGFNIIIFMITYLLNKVEMSMGAAFGLFAVFSMLRYRTENINAKDMTYLFIVIALGLITAISKGSWDDLAVMAVILLIFTALLENNWLIKKEVSKTIIYDKIDLITPQNYNLLLEDLKERTGLPVKRFEVIDIDFIRDSTELKIYFTPSK
ncbi:protein of unknown function [Spirosomataceae bacterium TFI 002]|nr:protein of unknown function [Spirosomataceae bacterium TFI 002]